MQIEPVMPTAAPIAARVHREWLAWAIAALALVLWVGMLLMKALHTYRGLDPFQVVAIPASAVVGGLLAMRRPAW